MDGDFLRGKIKEAGSELVDVAEKLGMSPQALNSKLNAKDLKLSFLCQVADAINKSVYFLVDGDEVLQKYFTPIESHYEGSDRHHIPLYNDVITIGGLNLLSEPLPINGSSGYVDAGDLFPGANAAIRHYGSSMLEYPNGCILIVRKVEDMKLIIWGKTYCIETDEYRITKSVGRSPDPGTIIGHSSNLERRPDGSLLHEPIEVPIKKIRRLFKVLGSVTHEASSIRVIES